MTMKHEKYTIEGDGFHLSIITSHSLKWHIFCVCLSNGLMVLFVCIVHILTLGYD